MADYNIRPAKRESTPLLIGLIGPSGSGKTKSALRLASGIQRVRGGKIVGVDTEARRMLAYADQFQFGHIEFKPPHGSSNYEEVIKIAAQGSEGGIVIVDSMSHEHEGQDGYLEFHEKELERLAGNDYAKRERMKMLAWVKPAEKRRHLINVILQQNCCFIFNFRAKEKIKPVKGGEPIQLGWQPIAGEEFSYEMTLRCLLTPGSNGTPDWSPEAFKYLAARRDDHIRPMVPDGEQITEAMGQRLAEWAKGAPAAVASPELLKAMGAEAAKGMDALQAKWQTLSSEEKRLLADRKDGFKKTAEDADKARQAAAAPSPTGTSMPVDDEI